MKTAIACSKVSLFPPEHGGAKNLRSIMEALASDGVECRVLIKVTDLAHRFSGQNLAALDAYQPQDLIWRHRGVTYFGVRGETRELAAALAKQMRSFDPDRVILYDDAVDDGEELFRVAIRARHFVFLAQTIHGLPFGPYALRRSATVSSLLAQAHHVIAPSHFVRDYIKTHLGIESSLYRPDAFGDGPFANLSDKGNRYVTMINPCPWKGSSIFFKLAKARPDLEFAAVPTWGATPTIGRQLADLPNVTLLKETTNIDDIFKQTRVLLAPSLCQEAFGLVSPEALLRGIPVVASDIAGLRESTLGAAQLIPVEPLSFANPPQGDDPSQFVWEEPENPIGPWNAELNRLLEDSEHYARVSKLGKLAAEKFLSAVRAQSITAFMR